MKKPAQIAVVLAVAVVMLIAGCEEQSLSNTKKSKLIAAENIQLKKELEKRDREIEEQKKLVDKCLREKKGQEDKTQEKVEELMGLIFESFGEENKELRKENENLKAQVQQLEARIKQLETELEELKKPAPKPLPAEPQPL